LDILARNGIEARAAGDLRGRDGGGAGGGKGDETKYRRLFESLVDGYAAVDMGGRIVESNRAFESMLGYDAAELRGLTYADITPVVWHEAERKILETQILVRGYSDLFEKEYRRKDGSIIPVELRIFLMKDERGRDVGMGAIARDLSGRKRAEAAFEASEARFKATFEHAGIGMAIADSGGRILKVNRSFVEMMGYSEAELLAMKFTAITHPDDRKLDWDLFIELLAGVIPKFQIEKRYITAEGRILWGRLTVTLAGDMDGEGSLVIGMVEDITRRRQEDERLLFSLREKEVLLREIQHRVKNNLQLVTSMLSLQAASMRGCSDPEDYSRALVSASSRVMAMAEVHELFYSSGYFSEGDFGELLRTIIDELRIEGGAPDLVFSFDLDPVKMDLEQAIPCGLLVHEAVANIFRHAYPAGWKAEKVASITLHAKAEGGARIRIRDRGVGLAQASGATRGEGLGFSLMAALAKQLDASLSFASEGGTIVDLDLPGPAAEKAEGGLE
jgi:PAS domain S-box-containing protein